MKYLSVAAAIAALMFSVSWLARTSPGQAALGAEQELVKLELDWSAALTKPDLGFLDRIMAQDITWTDPSGTVWTKDQTLAVLKSGEDVVSSLVSDEMKVRIYGDAAVVTGRDTIQERLRGKDVSGVYRWTDTWIKIDGRWQCVATQSSKIAQK